MRTAGGSKRGGDGERDGYPRMRSKPAPLQCQQTGMYLEVTGFEKDFEMRFESLQKKFRTGQAGADIKEGEHLGDILCIFSWS